MAAGATTIHRLSYTRSNMESYKESLISEACLDGLKKANAAAHALGVVLGAPVSIEVHDAFTGREVAPVMALKAATGNVADSVSPGELEIEASVSLSFEI